jgi:LacI family transcriptional regulator
MALRIVSACHLAGLSIPDDVAVLGIDNDEELCEGMHPTISSIVLGFVDSGRLAAETLDQLISTPHAKPEHVMYPPLRLVRRESTRRLVKHDSDVAKAAERIRLEACNGLTADDIVNNFPCSRRMAELRFRKLIGRSILQEIRSVRLETAQHLLRTSSLGMDFIANKCGYGSLSSFSVFFHKETGFSPSAWRMKQGTISNP